MKRVLVIAVLTVAASAAALSQTPAVSQTNDMQVLRSQSEQELIALSREFVKTSFGAMVVETGGVKLTPSGPMLTLEVKEQREAVGIRDTEIHIDGNNAVVRGQVIFKGQSTEDKTRKTSNVTIYFRKGKEQWKLVRGCFGECGEQ
jgi:hypothetical protein